MKTLETPILVVGGGPVGLSTALHLAHNGIESMVVEKHRSTSIHPKASYFNVRTMEILGQLGVAEELYATALLGAGVSFYTNLTGHRLGGLGGADFPEYVASLLAATPRPGCVSSQIVLEAILKKKADENPLIHVLFNHAKTALVQDESSVRTTILDRESGESTVVASKYAIACDGVHSSTRDELGATMIGPPAFGHMINIYFEADIESLVPDSNQALDWISSPEAPGVFIGLGGDRRKWCFNTAYHPERGERPEDYTESRCMEKLHAALGTRDLPVKILAIGPWVLCGQVVDRYQVGRVFFGGDAAHLNIPTGGFGFNTGMQETHNLAWKIAGVLKGWAPDRLLDSYHAERRPIAIFNVEASRDNAMRIRETGASLGDAAPDVDDIDEDTAAGQTQRDRLSAAIARQRSHFLFLGQEIGFDYANSGLVVSDGTPHYVEEHGVEDPIFTYLPNARPGARAPHCWLTHSTTAGARSSILDLFDREFVLLVAGDPTSWTATLDAAVGDIPLRAVGIGPLEGGCEYDDEGGMFQSCYGIGNGGAVLVRPDGHVAWRAPTDAEHHLGVALSDALEIATARRDPPHRIAEEETK
jgi:2,4-dichlorophenol 6-monooxygenase